MTSPAPPSPGPLEHPLPAGMRDQLPEEAHARRALARSVLRCAELRGYGLVVAPAFEFAEVLERGLGSLDTSEVLRFIEPESGEVAALRPDMTPQIARMIATRLFRRPPPFRLAYEGSVVRRRAAQAHARRQIPQVGVELAGRAGLEGDLEILALVHDALQSVQIARFSIDLGDAGIVRALLADLPPETAASLGDAFADRDESAVGALLGEGGGGSPVLRQLVGLSGGADALREGQRLLRGTAAEDAAARLGRLFDAACKEGLEGSLSVDFGEMRGWAYYTGMRFHVYADGHGQAVGSGGRYDELLGRFGMPMPAVGFAFDLDALGAVTKQAGVAPAWPVRVLVAGPEARARVDVLRAEGLVAASHDDAAGAEAHARAWRFSHLLLEDSLVELATGAAMPWNAALARRLSGRSASVVEGA